MKRRGFQPRSTVLVILAISITLCSGSNLAHADSKPRRIPQRETLAARIDAFVRPYVQMGNFDGTVLVAEGPYVVVSRSYGMANYERGIPNDFNTRFRIASLSKQFTMAAVGILIDEGRLTGSSRLEEFISGFPNGDQITIEQLLKHRSGIPHANKLDWVNNATDIALDEIIEGLKREPLDFIPGTERRYSNGGYAVLARVIERISGLSYHRFLEDRLLRPLRLRHTAAVNPLDPNPDRAGIASGYMPGVQLGQRTQAPFYPAQIKVGGGDLLARAEDVWHVFRQTYQHMLHSQQTATFLFGERTGQGEITGRSPGFAGKVYIDIPNDIVIVSLANNYSFLGPWAETLYRVVMDEPHEFAELRFTRSTLSPQQAAYYVGRYDFGGSHFEIEANANGQLTYRGLKRNWRVVLVPLTVNRLYMPFYDRIVEFQGAPQAQTVVYHSRVRGESTTWTANRIADLPKP